MVTSCFELLDFKMERWTGPLGDLDYQHILELSKKDVPSGAGPL